MASTPEQRAYWKEQRARLKDKRKAYMVGWHLRNKEQQKEYAKVYNQTAGRKEQYSRAHKKYYAEHTEELRDYHKDWRDQNKQKLRDRAAAYYQEHKNDIKNRVKAYRQTSAGRASEKKYHDKIRATAHGRLRHNISSAVRLKLLNHGGKKYRASIDKVLPFKIPDLMARLESLFQPGMTWDNYGKWHVDHIIPDISFEYSTVECPGFKESWVLENLQPLWASENCSKGSKIITEA